MEGHKKILLVDFDGVIHSYVSGWQGAGVISDPPVDGAIRFLRLAICTFDVQIYSSRSQQANGIQAMKKWLGNWERETIDSHEEMTLIYSLSFPTQKPAAFLTIDDRCIQFNGEFPDIHDMVNFKPWNKRDE